MEITKKLLLIVCYVILRIILSPFWITVWILRTIETIIRITKETLTFFIKQIESEVF